MTVFICPKCQYVHETALPSKGMEHKCPKDSNRVVVMKERK